MGVGTNENAWWNDVLENGPASRYAGWFDIAWHGSPRTDLQDRVMLPVLGEPYREVLVKGEIRLTFERADSSRTITNEDSRSRLARTR